MRSIAKNPDYLPDTLELLLKDANPRLKNNPTFKGLKMAMYMSRSEGKLDCPDYAGITIQRKYFDKAMEGLPVHKCDCVDVGKGIFGYQYGPLPNNQWVIVTPDKEDVC